MEENNQNNEDLSLIQAPARSLGLRTKVKKRRHKHLGNQPTGNQAQATAAKEPNYRSMTSNLDMATQSRMTARRLP